MIIKKKILPEYFELMRSGKKKYELRLNDIEIREGDMLVLEEWNPEKKEYTGRTLEKRATSVEKFKLDEMFWSEDEIKKRGILIISLE